MSKQIKMTSPDGVTLYTSGKYVEDDIHVTNGLPTYSGENENGEVVGTVVTKLAEAQGSYKYIFYKLNLNSFDGIYEYSDTENANDLSHFFYGYAGNFIPNVNTNNITSGEQIFGDCTYLIKIDMSYYNSSGGFNQMCSYCSRLKAVIIRSFGEKYVLTSNSFHKSYSMLGETHATYNPNGEQGYVYVPRDMIATLQSATNWSILQFRALEDYTKDGTTTGEFDDAKAGLTL